MWNNPYRMILVSLSNLPGRMEPCSSITWNPPAFKTLPSLLSLAAMHVAARPCTQRCIPVPLTTIQQTSQTYCGLTLGVIFLHWQNYPNYPQLLPPLFATRQDVLKIRRLGNNTMLLHKINGQTLLSRHCPSAVYIGPPFRWLPSSLRALVASMAETLGHQSDGFWNHVVKSCEIRFSNEKKAGWKCSSSTCMDFVLGPSRAWPSWKQSLHNSNAEASKSWEMPGVLWDSLPRRIRVTKLIGGGSGEKTA